MKRDNNLHFMDFADENIGRIDAKAGAATIYPPRKAEEAVPVARTGCSTIRAGSAFAEFDPPSSSGCYGTRTVSCARSGTSIQGRNGDNSRRIFVDN